MAQQIMSGEPINMLLASAGGLEGLSGDYPPHTFLSSMKGAWALMRVSQELVFIIQI